MALSLFPLRTQYTKRGIAAGTIGELVNFLTRELGAVERAIVSAPLVATRTVTADTTLSLSDGLVCVDATDGAVTITLPALPAAGGYKLIVKRLNAGANAVTVTATENIDGGSVTLSAQYDGVSIVGDAATYHVVGRT